MTGASTPLAEAIAVALAGQGVKVCVSGPWAERVEAVVAAVRGTGGEAVGAAGPLETLEQAEALVARAVHAFGHVDLVIWITPFWNSRSSTNMRCRCGIACWPATCASLSCWPAPSFRNCAARVRARSWRSVQFVARSVRA